MGEARGTVSGEGGVHLLALARWLHIDDDFALWRHVVREPGQPTIHCATRRVVNKLPESELCMGALYGAPTILGVYNGRMYAQIWVVNYYSSDVIYPFVCLCAPSTTTPPIKCGGAAC